jgi:hypothetical protein
VVCLGMALGGRRGCEDVEGVRFKHVEEGPKPLTGD